MKDKNARKNQRKNQWIWSKYFIMKWRFRLDQARAIFALITFAAILAVSYVKYLTFLEDLGIWGVLLFTLGIFIIFVIGGYLYDRVFKLWSETQAVSVERNPYTYVPTPKEQWHSMAIYGYLFNALSKIAKTLDVELDDEEAMKKFLDQYLSLNAKTPDYELEVKKLKVISNKIKDSFIGLKKGNNIDDEVN